MVMTPSSHRPHGMQMLFISPQLRQTLSYRPLDIEPICLSISLGSPENGCSERLDLRNSSEPPFGPSPWPTAVELLVDWSCRMGRPGSEVAGKVTAVHSLKCANWQLSCHQIFSLLTPGYCLLYSCWRNNDRGKEGNSGKYHWIEIILINYIN